MADAVQHRRTLFARSLNSPFHFNESMARLPDFARAMRTKVKVSAFAKILRRLRQAQNGSNLIAQKNDRERQEEDHRPQHPEHENMGVRLVGESAARHQAEHTAPEIDAYLHQARSADGIDPEGLGDLLPDFLRKGPRERIQCAVEGARHDRRQRTRWQQ